MTNAENFVVAAALLAAACSASTPAAVDAQPARDAPGSTSDVPGPDAAVDAPSDALPDGPSTPMYRACGELPPPNAYIPATTTPTGTCGTLAAGTNTITSSSRQRDFILVVPANPDPTETFPILFMWHWIGGSANGFLERGAVQAAADAQRFIAVIPVARGATVFGTSFDTRWPFDVTQSASRMAEEFAFFDDMLGCVQQQFAINNACVSTIGISAGALFTAQLAQARSEKLGSFISLSGGTGATIIKPWTGASRKLPAIVLWGGDGPPAMDGARDLLGCSGIGMDFSTASNDLEAGLVAGGHFFVECKHNCGHTEPPLEGTDAMTKYAGIWEFALDHPTWLPEGRSPYEAGIPLALPSWCGVGDQSATPRMGDGCPEGENPCTQ